MILGDLFESKMSELDIEYQDWKNMSPVAFLSRYKMSKEAWYNKHQSLIPAEGGIQEAADKWAPFTVYNATLKKVILKTNDIDYAHKEAVEWAAEDDIITRVYNKDKSIIAEIDGYVGAEEYKEEFPELWQDLREAGAKERWAQAATEREKKHDEIEARRQEAARQGKTDVAGAIKRLEKALGEEGSHRFKGPHGVVDVDQSKPGVTKVTRHSDVGAKSFSNRDQNRSTGTGVKAGSGVSATQGTKRTFPRLNIDGPELNEQTQELSIGDPVIIQGTEYDGKTGEIGEFSPSGRFVVVDLYNYGPQAFNMANVKYNEYADDEDQVDEEQDACYRKVKSRYKVWPSAYASGALVQCRKKGAANWGNKTKK